VVIVDTLRFSTAIVTAIANDFTIYPFSDKKKGMDYAREIGAEISGKSGEAKYSLSPSSFMNAADKGNKKVVVFSPNGAACAELVQKHDIAYVGSLLNAKVVGKQIDKVAIEKKKNITIIAAGEQRAIDTGERIVYELKEAQRVFAVEDYLGAGAIISYSRLKKAPAAEVCELAFRAAQDRLKDFMLKSFSGKYLVQHSLTKDVVHAAQLNQYDIIPIIREGKIECF
jgi:2-phosphosulfolactate phosphatase